MKILQLSRHKPLALHKFVGFKRVVAVEIKFEDDMLKEHGLGKERALRYAIMELG